MLKLWRPSLYIQPNSHRCLGLKFKVRLAVYSQSSLALGLALTTGRGLGLGVGVAPADCAALLLATAASPATGLGLGLTTGFGFGASDVSCAGLTLRTQPVLVSLNSSLTLCLGFSAQGGFRHITSTTTFGVPAQESPSKALARNLKNPKPAACAKLNLRKKHRTRQNRSLSSSLNRSR